MEQLTHTSVMSSWVLPHNTTAAVAIHHQFCPQSDSLALVKSGAQKCGVLFTPGQIVKELFCYMEWLAVILIS